jgi:hypothetical protein
MFFGKCVVLAGGLFLLGGLATAAEPGEPLPLPRVLLPAAPIVYPRVSKYEVWQYYGIDRQGYFKPLVVATPYGAYYRYDGRPFPWVGNHPLEWMPYVVEDVPFRTNYAVPSPPGPRVYYVPSPPLP